MLLALAIVGFFVLPDPWRVVVLAVAALVEVGEVFFWIRFLRRYRVTTGAEGLIGEPVEVIEACDPVGRVRVRGEIWHARSEVPIGVGERAGVSAVDGLTVVLDPGERKRAP
jgi:membrane-bound serine protease (ClpP class)